MNPRVWIPGRGGLAGTWIEAILGGCANGVATLYSSIPDDPCPIERPIDELRFDEPAEGERPRASASTVYGGGRVALQVLSHTKVSTKRDCAAKFGYRYVDGLRPKVEKDPTRLRGRGLHEGFAAGFRAWQTLRRIGATADEALLDVKAAARRACDAAHAKVLEELAEARRNGAEVETCDDVEAALVEGHEADSWALQHFFDVRVPRDYARKIPILIEAPFEVPIRDAGGAARHLRWYGYLDLVMYDERMRVLEVHEQKTVSSKAGSDEHRRRIEGDPQTTGYVYALREMQARGDLDRLLCELTGRMLPPDELFAEPRPDAEWARKVPVGSVAFSVLRRKQPSEPATLKDGTISTDRRIDTLPEVYEAALDRWYAENDEPEYVLEARAVSDAALVEMKTAQAALDAERELRTKPATKTLERDLERMQKRAGKAYAALQKKIATWTETKRKQTELLDRLRDRGDTFLADLPEQFVADAELERWRGEMWVEAERIRRIERRPAERTRNLGFCTAPGRGCTYRTLCYSGGDAQIRETEFTTPEQRAEQALEDEREETEKSIESPAYEASGWT